MGKGYEHEKKNVGRGETGVLVIVCFFLLAMTCVACGDGETTTDSDRQSVTVLYIGDERIFRTVNAAVRALTAADESDDRA